MSDTTRPRIDGIPHPERPDDPEASLVPSTSDGRETAIWLGQVRQWFHSQLVLRQAPGRTADDYVPASVRAALFPALPPACPLYVLDESDKTWFQDQMSECGMDGFQIDPDNGGSHIDVLGLSIVWRSAECEALCGPEYTASIVVHEMAHAAQAWGDTTLHLRRQRDGSNDLVQRMGFKIAKDTGGPRGDFFEEGYAELQRYRYLRACARTSRLARVLGERFDLGPDENAFDSDALVGDPDDPSQVPMILVHPKPDGNNGLTSGGAACKALLLLADRIPGFMGMMLEARRSTDGLRHFWAAVRAQLGDAVVKDLRALQDTTEDGLRGLKIVRDALAARPQGAV